MDTMAKRDAHPTTSATLVQLKDMQKTLPLRVLTPEDLRLSKTVLKEAINVEPTIYEIIDKFLAGKREIVKMPPYKHDDIEKMLTRTMQPEEYVEKLAAFKGSPAGDDYIACANTVLTYLRTKIPRRFVSTVIGPVPTKASDSELMTFRWFVETVNDPVWAVRQMLASMLNNENIEGLTICWPDALQAARTALQTGIAGLLAKDEAYAFDRWQVRQIAVLMQSDPTCPPELVRSMQDAFVQEQHEQNNQATREASAKMDEGLETSLQKTANR